MKLFLLTSKNTFEEMLPGEKTIFVTRKHWFVVFSPLLFISLPSLFPFFTYFFIRDFSWYPKFAPLFWFLVIVCFLTLWILLFYKLMIYLLTCLVITNKRIVWIETRGFFRYKRLEAKLGKIQDVSVKITGISATFLNFGDIFVQTAGAVPRFNFYQLPKPEKIKGIIFSLLSTKS